MKEFGDNPCIGCSDKGLRCIGCKHNPRKKKSNYEPNGFPRYIPYDRIRFESSAPNMTVNEWKLFE